MLIDSEQYFIIMHLKGLIYFTTLVKKNYMDRDIFSRRLVKILRPKKEK